MREDDLALFNDSLDRCLADPGFLDRFYDHFVTSSGEVAAMFAGVDMRRQKRALKASLYLTVLAADGNAPALEHLAVLARRHERLGIRRRLYDVWRECLMATVAEADPELGPEGQAVWRRVLEVGIERVAGP